MTPILTFLLANTPDAGLTGELATHPYVTGLVIALLFAAFVGLAKLFLVQFEKRVNEKFDEQGRHNVEQDERLDKIESELKRYDTHVALGARESAEIHASMSRVEAALVSHVEKEEGTTWAKIDSLVEAVNSMKLSNEVAHAGLVAGQEILSTRVSAVEKKMPNGELARLADAFERLAKSRG